MVIRFSFENMSLSDSLTDKQNRQICFNFNCWFKSESVAIFRQVSKLNRLLAKKHKFYFILDRREKEKASQLSLNANERICQCQRKKMAVKSLCKSAASSIYILQRNKYNIFGGFFKNVI